jgi:RNA polymerase sigma-70 factor (ECF subfamily)
MNPEHTIVGQFPHTSWTQITMAQGKDTTAGASLEMFCRLYWAPLYAFTRRNGMAPEEAEDVTQSFFVHLFTNETLAGADQSKGKLRSYLLGALKNFLHNWRRADNTVKRGGRLQRVDFDTREVEAVCATGNQDGLTPDAFFERRWAVTLLDLAMRDLENEQLRAGKATSFAVLSEYLMMHGKEADHSIAAQKLGMNEGAVRVAVHRLRKRYRELVRLHVSTTVDSEAEVDDELRHLLSLYSR